MSKYFGTDGVRGVAYQDITKQLAYRIGRYLGYYPNGKKNKIIIGRDTRYSGHDLEVALVEGILTSGSFVDTLQITTTPSISYLVQNGEYDFGIMISASHNPCHDNGIKVFSNNGEKLCAEIEDLIEQYIDSEEDYLPKYENNDFNYAYRKDLVDEYLNFLASKTVKPLKKFNILIDCANGSASAFAKHYFGNILNQNVTCINDDYDGFNINQNCGSTHIETLVDLIKKSDYDFALSFDGDADRLMIVNKDGKIIDGDIFMFISAMYLHQKNKLNGNTVVITKMSNLGLKKALKEHDLQYFEVDVGDKYVHQALKKYDWSLGGEQSGHVMFFEDMNTGSGFLSATKLLSILSETNSNISELSSGIKIYPQYLINVRVKDKKTILDNQIIKDEIENVNNILGTDGRLLVRPSGTENLIRVMVEAETEQLCQKLANQLVDTIKSVD